MKVLCTALTMRSNWLAFIYLRPDWASPFPDADWSRVTGNREAYSKKASNKNISSKFMITVKRFVFRFVREQWER